MTDLANFMKHLKIQNEKESRIDTFIDERFKENLDRLKELPKYEGFQQSTILQWKTELETMESKKQNIISILICKESEKPAPKPKSGRLSKWEDEPYQELLDKLLDKISAILENKSGTTTDSTPLATLWRHTSSSRDPQLGQKLMDRLAAYYTSIQRSDVHPYNTFMAMSDLNKFHDEMQEFIDSLDMKHLHGWYAYSCSRNVFQNICQKTYADAYEDWLADKSLPVPSIQDMMNKLIKDKDYPSADKYFKRSTKRINNVKKKKQTSKKEEHNEDSSSDEEEE